MTTTKGLLQRFLDPPSSTAIDDAVQRLIEIGAISDLKLELTPLGHHLSFVPIEIRLAKMCALCLVLLLFLHTHGERERLLGGYNFPILPTG